MSNIAPIVMGARVVAVERPIIELAVQQLEASLNTASASGFSIRIEFIDPETLPPPVSARIVLISLRAEAVRLAEPWLETERRLRGQCKALLDNNDLSLGIVQAQQDTSSYYILGYYSSNRE